MNAITGMASESRGIDIFINSRAKSYGSHHAWESWESEAMKIKICGSSTTDLNEINTIGRMLGKLHHHSS